METTLFCLHEKCSAQSRLLSSMADVPKHSDNNKHKLCQFKDLKAYVIAKFGADDLKSIQKVLGQEKVTKESIQKAIQEIKDKLDIFQLNELKKLPSLTTIQGYINAITKADDFKEITSELIRTLVEFNVDKINKYQVVLQSTDQYVNQLKAQALELIKPNNNDLSLATLAQIKYTWSDQNKASIYQITNKEIEATTTFLGWSFACTSQIMNLKSRYEIKLEITELPLQVQQLSQSKLLKENDKKTKYSFAIGVISNKERNQKGLESLDLSVIGHGFYVLRSDGWTCHNSDKTINWKQTLAFQPDLGQISMKFDPSEGELTIEQLKNKYLFKVEKIDGYFFCVHLKGCKAKIIDS